MLKAKQKSIMQIEELPCSYTSSNEVSSPKPNDQLLPAKKDLSSYKLLVGKIQ